MRVPPFHFLGEDDSHFYALAYVPGSYVPPSGKSQGEAFFVLSFSPSEGFTRFSVSTLAPDGHLFHYSRGTDELDSAEYAMLRAWREERVPLHTWQFYPSAAVEAAAFTGDSAQIAYEAARHRVAYIIFQARAHAWVQTRFAVEPTFRFSEADIPDPMAETPESEEITKYVLLNPMTVTELLPTLRGLSRADKLKVMQFLIAELVEEEEPALQPGATYSIWSPLNSHEAAHKLAQLLESEQPT